MTSRYKHTQIGTIIIVLMTIAAIGAAVAVFLGWRQSAGYLAALVVFVVLALLTVMFSALTIEITDESVLWRFGPGFSPIRHSKKLEEIASVEVVQNPWWYGWGIRLTPHGWLYNVSGKMAVELQLKNGKRIRLGTDQPDELAQAIRDGLRM